MMPRPEVLSVARRKIKLAGALRTIGDAAVELDVEPHVLRFWETRFPQVAPVRRRGGRRFYRPEDMELLRRIRGMLYREGCTIKGVQRMLDDELAVPAPLREIEARPDPWLDAEDPQPLAPAADGHTKPDIVGVLRELQDALAALRQALMVS